MTYVKVTKYTQKLWRIKVWFLRKLSCASWDKWETRLLAPHESFHGTGWLTVGPESPYMRWRTPSQCLALLSRSRYCSVSRFRERQRCQDRAAGSSVIYKLSVCITANGRVGCAAHYHEHCSIPPEGSSVRGLKPPRNVISLPGCWQAIVGPGQTCLCPALLVVAAFQSWADQKIQMLFWKAF